MILGPWHTIQVLCPSYWYQTNLVPVMHDKLAKFLVWYSGTSNLDRELGSCAMGLSCCIVFHRHLRYVGTSQAVLVFRLYVLCLWWWHGLKWAVMNVVCGLLLEVHPRVYVLLLSGRLHVQDWEIIWLGWCVWCNFEHTSVIWAPLFFSY